MALLGLAAAALSAHAQNVLACNQGAPGNLVVDGARVYWIDRQTGAVSSVDKFAVNCAPVMIHSPGNGAPGWELRQDDAFLYYSADGNFPAGGPTAIWKVPKTSASVTQLSPNGIVPPFAINTGFLYYIGTFREAPDGRNSDALVSLSTQGGNEKVLLWNSHFSNAQPYDYYLGGETSFTSDGTYVYWSQTDNTASGIFHIPLAGGPATTDVSTTDILTSVVVPSTGATSSYMFWLDTTSGELMMKPPGGVPVAILDQVQSPGGEFVHPFVVIGSDVYAGRQGALVRVHIDTTAAFRTSQSDTNSGPGEAFTVSGPVTVVPAPNAFPIAVTSDCSADGACNLYWSELSDSSIRRVAITAAGTSGGGGPAPSPTATPSATPATRNPYMQFAGTVTWQTNGTTATLTANQISYTKAGTTSYPIRVELWAFSHPFGGIAQTGYRLATYSLPALQAGSSYNNVNSGPIAFTPPPNGWWHIAMLLTEQTNQSSADDGYSFDDWVDFANPYVVGGSAAPTPTPAQLANISTRGVIQSGDSVMIGGFIVTGSAQKKIIVRGIGPSLPVTGALPDPTLELHGPNGTIAMNDNWQDSQPNDISATGVAPTNNLEPALIASLTGNNTGYTAILAGKNGESGIGLIEVYDLSMSADSTLANISTRGYVDVGDNVMIGGFITTPGSGACKILVRGIGPSLTASGVSGALADPMLELHDANGGTVATNDNWKDTQQSEIAATGIPPAEEAESALVQTLWAGNYTAVLRGKSNSTGVGLVEIYNLH